MYMLKIILKAIFFKTYCNLIIDYIFISVCTDFGLELGQIKQQTDIDNLQLYLSKSYLHKTEKHVHKECNFKYARTHSIANNYLSSARYYRTKYPFDVYFLLRIFTRSQSFGLGAGPDLAKNLTWSKKIWRPSPSRSRLRRLQSDSLLNEICI